MIAKKNPNYSLLIKTLIEQTHRGKLEWQETAEPDRFLAAVKGIQTYQVARDAESDTFHLTVRDTNGDVYLDFDESGDESGLDRLFQAVASQGARLDERIGKSVQLLNSL